MAKTLGKSPWRTIWNMPRQTIRTIVDTNPSRDFLFLAAIYGFPSLVYLAQLLSLGTLLHPLLIVLIALLLSPLFGYAAIWIWAKLLRFTGKWIGGLGTDREIRAAVAWGNVPQVVNVLFWILVGSFFGHALFIIEDGNVALSTTFLQIIRIGALIQVVILIWSTVIFVLALAEVQQFSVLRAIANGCLAGVCLMVAWGIINIIGNLISQ